jgi:hypothetical protein
MKIVISESQYQRLIETKEKPKILEFPSLEFFDNNPFEAWKIIQKILERKGNPPYSIEGNLNLRGIPIQSLGNLQSVGGNLFLDGTPIESLGNLVSVGENLDLEETPIQSLGNLQSVGGYLALRKTRIQKKYTEEEIRQMVNVGGKIYL